MGVIHRFGGFTLNLKRGVLLAADGTERTLRPKSFALLRHMVENAERLLSRDELMGILWPGLFVTEENLAQCVRDVRRALGDEAQMVRTMPRRGYLFTLPVAPEILIDETRLHVAAERDDEVPPRPMVGRPMIVVRPFATIAGDSEQVCFADGLTADLVADLTRFQDLHIVSPYRPSGPHRGAEALPGAASYVVSGDIVRVGGRIRVAARLDDARDGASLWVGRFDRSLDDLFDVQQELANQIAGRLECQVSHEGLRRARRRAPNSLGVYDLCLRARARFNATTEDGTLVARALLDRAIALDPEHAPAYAWKSRAVQRGFTLHWGEPRGRAALDPALHLARHAAALEPDSSVCLILLAWALSMTGRHDEALAIAHDAITANPSDFNSRTTYGEILSRAGKHAAGVEELRLAMSLNPFLPPFWRATLGRALLLANEPEEALAHLLQCAALAPDYAPCHSSILVACMETGRLEEARGAMRELLRLRPGWKNDEHDGVWGFRREADTDRFLSAFRNIGMPEGTPRTRHDERM